MILMPVPSTDGFSSLDILLSKETARTATSVTTTNGVALPQLPNRTQSLLTNASSDAMTLHLEDHNANVSAGTVASGLANSSASLPTVAPTISIPTPPTTTGESLTVVFRLRFPGIAMFKCTDSFNGNNT